MIQKFFFFFKYWDLGPTKFKSGTDGTLVSIIIKFNIYRFARNRIDFLLAQHVSLLFAAFPLMNL